MLHYYLFIFFINYYIKDLFFDEKKNIVKNFEKKSNRCLNKIKR